MPGFYPNPNEDVPQPHRRRATSGDDHQYLRDSSAYDDKHDEDETSWFPKIKKSKTMVKTRRVCEKSGNANVQYKNVSEKRRRYVSDIYTTLVDSR